MKCYVAPSLNNIYEVPDVYSWYLTSLLTVQRAYFVGIFQDGFKDFYLLGSV